MKRVKLSLITLLVGTSFAVAGGDILPESPYVIEDIKAAEVVKVTPASPKPKVVVPSPKPKVIIPLSQEEISAFYVALGFTAAQYKTACKCSQTDKTLGGIIRVGYDLNQYLGMEARAIITPLKSNGGEIQHYGAFFKPIYPVTDELNVYGLGGIAKTKTKGSLPTANVSGLAFGAGLEYDLSDDKKNKDTKYDREFDGQADQERGLGLFADYERLYYKSGSPDLDAVSIGVTYDF